MHLGQNLTVPCPIHKANDVMWVKKTSVEHLKVEVPIRMEVLEDGSLFLENVTRNDSGIYVCNRENVVHNEVKARVKVEVKSRYLNVAFTKQILFIVFKRMFIVLIRTTMSLLC